MSIIKKVRAVEKVFQALEKETSEFQIKSGLKCNENCHLCCTKKDIQANSLEFLPLAYHLYITNQAYTFLEKLEQTTLESICILYNPFNEEGACSYYPYRGLICRLFGFSANLDKNGLKNLITCKTLKTEKKSVYALVQSQMNYNLNVPLASSYYMKLYSIDLKLSSTYYPINEAIQKAIETVLFYFSFRNKRAG